MSASSTHSHSDAQAGEAQPQAGVAGAPARWRRVLRRSWTGARYAVGAALGLWIGDFLVLLPARGGASWVAWLTGLGVALFVAATSAAALGALLGPALVPAAEHVWAQLVAWWRGLHDEEGGAGAALAARGLALLGLGALAALAIHRVVLAILFGIARGDTTQIALVASHLAFALLLAPSWPLAVRAARAGVRLLSRARGTAWLLDRPARVLGAFGAVVLAGAAGAGVAYRHELAAVHWLPLTPPLLLVPGALVVRDLPRIAPPWGRRLTRAALVLVALVLGGAVVAAVRLRPESTTAQVFAFDRAWSGRWGMTAWTAAFDFDRDGQLSFLGGGDCAPFDPRRHAGAPDVPGNHIDEDCDGVDGTLVPIRPRSSSNAGHTILPQHPTIVLVTIDALGAPFLKALGGTQDLMPHLDELATKSMLFTHCFSQGPSTRLSFPSMFTGRWDSQLVFNYAPRMPYPLDPKEKQVQDLLDDAGYDTVAVIPDSYFSKTQWPSVTKGFGQVDTSALGHGKHDASEVTDAAVKELSAPRERPLYMWVHYYDAHPPYGPINGFSYADRSDRSYYDAELQYIDRNVARLIDAVAARSEPTYLFVTADHSTVFHPNPELRHFHYGYDLYTATLHVPLLVSGPKITPGRVEELVSTMDVAPTILDIVRGKSLPNVQGTSLVPELFSGAHDAKRVLFHEYFLPEFTLRGRDPLQIVSVRDGRYNLVLNRERGTYEMYDWKADYFEQDDLYEGLAHTAEAGRMRSMLGSFLLEFASRRSSDVLVAPPEPIGAMQGK